MATSTSIDASNLLPKIELLLNKEFLTPEGLAATVVAFILFLFFSALLLQLTPGTLRAVYSIGFFFRLLKKVSTETLTEKRRNILARASKRRRLGALWSEFDETLVESPDGQYLYNTFGADHFFNTHTLATGVTESRLLAAIPGVLTAIGVIGTFIGLQLGLSGLDIGDTEKAHNAINQLIGGASVAFMTSVWGVGASVVFNVIEKLIEQSLRKRIAKLQARIDSLFPRISPEQTLLYIRDDSKKSGDVLEGLAERIGAEMQKRMADATERMQTGIESGLERVLAPALAQLVQASNDLSDRQASGAESALSALIETHIQSLNSAGEAQKDTLADTAQKVDSSLEGLKTTIDGMSARISEQQEKMRQEQGARDRALESLLQKIVVQQSSAIERTVTTIDEKITALADQIGQKSDAVQSAAEEQVQNIAASQASLTSAMGSVTKTVSTAITQNSERSQELVDKNLELFSLFEQVRDDFASTVDTFHSATGDLRTAAAGFDDNSAKLATLSTTLEHMRTSVTDLSERARENGAMLQEQLEAVGSLGGSLEEATESVNATVASMNKGVAAHSEHQQSLHAALVDHVEQMKKRMVDMLNEYGQTVEGQTTERLRSWNKETLEFTNAMTEAIRVINEVVDEIDAKMGA